MKGTILGIESSCDDTSAGVVENGYLLSNLIAGQQVHRDFGGVVPELASRAHQKHIIPVVQAAVSMAGKSLSDLNAIAYTRGPGLMGSLLVGASFAKGLALALKLPLIDVNHLHAHILSVFIRKPDEERAFPRFPFLCLLVSGGHTQLVVMRSHLQMEIIGGTIDDAAGEAFDKCAKVIGLPYPGGPAIDKMAAGGNPNAISFSKAVVGGLDYSFSGLKTSFLYTLREKLAGNAHFIKENLPDICASVQHAIIESLMEKLVLAAKNTGISDIAVAGGVSANSALRKAVYAAGQKYNWHVFIPEPAYATDNAAMVAIAGYFKYTNGIFSGHDLIPVARFEHL